MLDDKVAIVTGGSKGIGKAIVENFVQSGCKVVFTYLKSEKNALEICEKYADKVIAYKADASDYNEAVAVVEKTINKFAKIDILVNNVGLAKDKPIWSVDEESWNFTIGNTLNPCFNYTKATVNHFISQCSGKIINIGSINGIRGREGSIGYCTSKAGMIGFTKTLAKELGKYNINVNLVAPGYVDSDGQRNTSELIKKLVLDECAIRRLVQPSEVADLVEFLASSKAKSITGQVIQIDCGQYI